MGKWATEKKYNFVIDTTAVQTRLKLLIKNDVLKGVSKELTIIKAKTIIKNFGKNIGLPSTRNEFEVSLAENFLRWYKRFYGLHAAIRIFEQTNMQLVNATKIDSGERFDGVMFNIPNRPYLSDNRRGTALVEDYQAQVKSALQKQMTTAVKDLTKQDAKLPSGASLRNLSEVKVRWESNVNDMQNYLAKGINLVWASSHVDASIRCTPWQARLYSLDGTSGTIDGIPFIPLEVAMNGTLKDGNGLLRYNCRHRLIPYIKSSTPPKDYTKTEMDKARYVDQTQRRIERDIRQSKEEGHLLRGIDSEESKKAFLKAREKEEKYREFSKENKVPAYIYRTQVTREEITYNKVWIKNALDNEQARVYNTINTNYKSTNFTAKGLIRHSKHFNQYGNEKQYINEAKKLLDSSVDGKYIYGYSRKNGDVIKYRVSDNSYAIGKKDGTIRTIFKPDEGALYYITRLKEDLLND